MKWLFDGMVKRKIYTILVLFVMALTNVCFAEGGMQNDRSEGKKHYYRIQIFTEIGTTSWQYLRNGLAEAKAKDADAVFLHMNTYGGLVEYADSMRSAIINFPKPIYVFIDNNAASAGALISIACDSIYMREGANIGAASVVNQSGEKMPDKYQSYMRSLIRSTAQSHGKKCEDGTSADSCPWVRDPSIAEAMVDEFVSVPGLVDSTKILTMTAKEAMEHGYCEGIYENIDEIIVKALHENDYEICSYESTVSDDVKGWLMNPALQGVLIMLIIGGLYFEMQTPGVGFALAVSVLAAILYFAPLYIDGLATAWEGLVIVVGIILIIAEVFFIPGFGVAGILGISLMVLGLIFSLVSNDFFSFETVSNHQLYVAMATVLFSLIGSFVLVVYLSNKIGTDGIFKNLALTKSLENDYVGVSQQSSSLVGKEGVAETVLGPSGKVNIEGETYDAVCENGYVDEGAKVVVRRNSMGQLYVKKIE